jgi:hypothetical protein
VTAGEDVGQLHLVVDPDATGPEFGDPGLEPPGPVDGAGVDGHHSEPAALVEAESPEVVVPGDQPDAAATKGPCLVDERLQQRGRDTDRPDEGVQGDHLELVAGGGVGGETDQAAVELGQVRRQRGGGVHPSPAHHVGGTPP